MAAIKSVATTLTTPRILERRGAPRGDITHFDVWLFMATVVLNLLGLAFPLATLHVYDRVLSNEAYETLAVLTLGLVGVVLVETTLRILQSRVTAVSSARYARDLKVAAVKRALSGPHADGRRTPTETLEQLQAVDRFGAFFGGPARMALVDFPFAVIALGLIAVLAGWIVLAPITVIALYLFLLSSSGRTLRSKIRAREDVDLKSNDFLTETFDAILTVKSWGLEPLMMRRYERLLNASTLVNAEIVRLNAGLQRLGDLFGSTIFIATLAAGASVAIQGDLSIGVLAAVTLLAGRAAQPALRASRAWNDLQRAAISAEAMLKLFPPADGEQPEAGVVGERAAGPPTLAIGGAGACGPGGLIIATGSDAASRTTGLEMVAGLRRLPDSGLRIQVDDAPPTLYRRRFTATTTFLGRDDAAFRGTVLENLTLFGLGAPPHLALKMSERLGLDDEIGRLPNGYDTWIGDAIHDALSPAGNKKLVLARALSQRPRLLVLDEPTAHLSQSDCERLVQVLVGLRRYATVVVATEDRAIRSAADAFLALPDVAHREIKLAEAVGTG